MSVNSKTATSSVVYIVQETQHPIAPRGGGVDEQACAPEQIDVAVKRSSRNTENGIGSPELSRRLQAATLSSSQFRQS
jgi:hypothetical protein